MVRFRKESPTMRISLYVTILALVFGAGAVSANEGGHAAGWERAADNEPGNLPSLQRGARNFMAYCSGCHSLKFNFLPGGSEPELCHADVLRELRRRTLDQLRSEVAPVEPAALGRFLPA